MCDQTDHKENHKQKERRNQSDHQEHRAQ
jgi:hypothetical protein